MSDQAGDIYAKVASVVDYAVALIGPQLEYERLVQKIKLCNMTWLRTTLLAPSLRFGVNASSTPSIIRN